MITLISANEALVERIRKTTPRRSKWKCSEFNYIKTCNTGYLVYNTLYNSLFRLDEEEYEEFCSLNSQATHKKIWIKNGLWVPEDFEECKDYVETAQHYSARKRPLSITITSTMKCNAKCSYCYEKNVLKQDMEPQVVRKIRTFLLKQKVSSGVRINWFGGEPLLNQNLLDKVSNMLRAQGISYHSYLITNGSLLDEAMIKEKFPLWKVRDVQISLDGTKKEYERRKKYQETDMYEKVMENICLLAKYKINVHIRLNTDSKNRANIIRLAKELEQRFGEEDRVTYYPAFLTGDKKILSEAERLEFVGQMIRALGNTRKLLSATKFYSTPRVNACMKHDPNCFTIDVNGNLYDCEHFVGKEEMAIGTLSDFWKKSDGRKEPYELAEECEKCVFLPKCMGGCEINRQVGDIPCLIDKYMIMAYIDYLAEF